jgi:hypothetical protein
MLLSEVYCFVDSELYKITIIWPAVEPAVSGIRANASLYFPTLLSCVYTVSVLIDLCDYITAGRKNTVESDVNVRNVTGSAHVRGGATY